MIEKAANTIALHTEHTSYLLRILKTGHPEHLYYGKRIHALLPEQVRDAIGKRGGKKQEKKRKKETVLPCGAESLYEKHAFVPGNTNTYDREHTAFSLEDMNLEFSSYGKGDIREPFVEIEHADGSFTSDFLFETAEITKGKEPFVTLPGSLDPGEGEDRPEHLCLTFRDKSYDLVLKLHYFVFAACDVITRSAELINESGDPVTVRRLMSGQLDFDRAGFVMHTFTGAWAREMNKNDIPLQVGRYVNASYTGTSSNRANPFVMLSRDGTTEDTGEAWGLNLVYSGNHYEAAEVSSHGKTRIVWGINPRTFSWELTPGEIFEAPEAVMTWSDAGFNGMSQNLHTFVSNYIIRGEWRNKERPILLNSWEAAYFDINEHKLLKLAKAAAGAGIELFVMDDGWFKGRNDDTSSLGDWEPDEKKLPGGLAGICDKVKALGIGFGIWMEPEMVNENSDLYRSHPDWTLEIPGKPHSEGRNQRILDLTNEKVQDFLIRAVSRVLTSADISYLKWDMNRIMSDVFSQSLSAGRQGEVFHRYVTGLYRVLKELTERFPKVLFEGCSSGGNRFDLGMLCFFPQIWASDNTDAICRAAIQTGYSYGYPMQSVSCHVSGAPNHQTLRTSPLSTRFAAALPGAFGYEVNLCDLKPEELSDIKKQVALYKEWRSLFTSGRFYRGRTFFTESRTEGAAGGGLRCGYGQDSGNVTEWTVVSPDRKAAVGILIQKLMSPNVQYQYFRPRGLDEKMLYHFTGQPIKHNIKVFGDLINTQAPVHIRQDSVLHDMAAHFVKMDGETEDYLTYGDSLRYAGVKLSQGFGGTGYDERVRLFQDFASRVYFMVAEEEGSDGK